MNYDEYSHRRYIPELDGLRGLSVILVITHHLRDQRYWSWLMGQLGVSIFFVISRYPGTFTVTLTVTDNNGVTGSASVVITAKAPKVTGRKR